MSSDNGSDSVEVDAAASAEAPVVAKPLLASEALMDDLAPVEPAQFAARAWCVALALLFIGLGLSPAHQHGPGIYLPSDAHYVLGALALLVAIVPLPYRLRASAMVLVAWGAALLGVAGHGPLGALADATGEWGLLQLLAATSVPAALVFRANYRAYAGARYILAAALILVLPLVGHSVWLISQETLALQIASSVALLTLALSLLGFMGSETTIAGTYIGGAVILALTAQLCAIYAARLDPPQSWLDAGWAFASLAAFPCVSAVAAIGTFQLLAARYWGHARKGPLRRSDTLRSKLHSLSDSWSGHR